MAGSFFLELAGNLLLFALVFGMSATVDIDSMKQQAGNRKAILAGLVCQFVVLPFLGFLVVNAFNFDHDIGVTLLVVTSSPGGSYSNWWCSLFNADLALSVTMTAISTILSIAILPLNLLLYTRYSYNDDVIHQLDWHSLFLALFIVIFAIALGLYCSYRNQSYKFNQRANQLGNFAGLCLIIFSALVTNTGDSDSKIWARSPQFYIGVALPCVFGLAIATLIASWLGLEPPERVTVAIECCYQNVGIASSLALTMFKGDELNDAMGVPFFYGLVEGLFIGLYCVVAWKSGWTKAPKGAPMWHVMITSYEVINAAGLDLSEIEVSYRDEEGPMQGDEKSEDGRTLTHYFNGSTRGMGLTIQSPPAATQPGAKEVVA